MPKTFVQVYFYFTNPIKNKLKGKKPKNLMRRHNSFKAKIIMKCNNSTCQ